MRKRLTVLMLTWEFPPYIIGGLGMACYGLIKSLLEQGVRVFLILPAEATFYFDLEKPEDADLLPQIFLNDEKPKKSFKTVEQRLAYYGISRMTGVYVSRVAKGDDKKRPQSEPKTSRTYTHENVFLWSNRYTVRALKIARHITFDVIHAHDWFTFPAALALRSLTGKPLVCHVHSTEYDRAGVSGDPRIHGIEMAAFTQSDRIIAVSKYTSSMLVRRYLVKPAKIKTVHNAYGPMKNKCTRGRIFKDPVVLFLGRITQQKGPEYFLEVAKKVIEAFPGVRFVMAGEGNMEKMLIHRSAYYGLGTRFLFTGFLNRANVLRVLSASDIIVMPSVAEPFGIVPLEAMSYGLAVVISKQAGVAEVVKNAIKVDYWDVDRMVSVIIKLLKNPAKMREIGALCAKEVQRINWNETAGKVVKVYEELIC